jgi:hypothetical protein
MAQERGLGNAPLAGALLGDLYRFIFGPRGANSSCVRNLIGARCLGSEFLG